MVRHTSLEAYEEIKQNGLLGERQFQVYETLAKSWLEAGKALSQAECWKLIEATVETDRPSITPRFAELEKKGLVEPCGERECAVTGKNVLVWKITNNLPKDQIDECICWAVCSEMSGRSGHVFKYLENAEIFHQRHKKKYPDSELLKMRRVLTKRERLKMRGLIITAASNQAAAR